MGELNMATVRKIEKIERVREVERMERVRGVEEAIREIEYTWW